MKRGRGEAVLEYLVKRADGAERVSTIAVGIGKRDGRAVAQPLRHLEQAKLVRRTERDLWYATGRGREVDRILDEVVAARGGTFRGLYAAGITTDEVLALRS